MVLFRKVAKAAPFEGVIMVPGLEPATLRFTSLNITSDFSHNAPVSKIKTADESHKRYDNKSVAVCGLEACHSDGITARDGSVPENEAFIAEKPDRYGNYLQDV